MPGARKDRHENIGFGQIGFDTPFISFTIKILQTFKDPGNAVYPFRDPCKKAYAPYKYEIENAKKRDFLIHRLKQHIINAHEKE